MIETRLVRWERNMLVSLVGSAVLVITTIVFHYEALRLLSRVLPFLSIPVRVKVLLVVLCCFAAHTIEVWIYALAYVFLNDLGWGSLHGRHTGTFSDYLYFSATSYSTLGFGDISPEGSLRVISGVVGLNGLFLVAWSTSFTYFVMDRLWPLHPEND